MSISERIYKKRQVIAALKMAVAREQKALNELNRIKAQTQENRGDRLSGQLERQHFINQTKD